MRHIRPMVFAIAIASALVIAIAVTGCAGNSPAAERKAKCFANETLISAAMRAFKADAGVDAPLSDVIDKLHAVCPSGGTYSYDPATGVVTCSVHGHA